MSEEEVTQLLSNLQDTVEAALKELEALPRYEGMQV